MISIVVCSINSKLMLQLDKNIKDTIGVEYELISFNNEDKNWGICKAYNYCAQKAKYDNLVFIHEDLSFYEKDWGEFLIKILSDLEVGIIGVSGAVYKSSIPSTWSSIMPKYFRTNTISTLADGTKCINVRKADDNAYISEVAVLDGCFLAMRREIWKTFLFNENIICGFHFYDLDISLRVGRQFSLYVQHNFLVEHASYGVVDKTWIEQALVTESYFKKLLPVSILPFSKKEKKRLNYLSAGAFVWICFKNNFFCFKALYYFVLCFKISFLKKNNLDMLKYIIFHRKK